MKHISIQVFSAFALPMACHLSSHPWISIRYGIQSNTLQILDLIVQQFDSHYSRDAQCSYSSILQPQIFILAPNQLYNNMTFGVLIWEKFHRFYIICYSLSDRAQIGNDFTNPPSNGFLCDLASNPT